MKTDVLTMDNSSVGKMNAVFTLAPWKLIMKPLLIHKNTITAINSICEQYNRKIITINSVRKTCWPSRASRTLCWSAPDSIPVALPEPATRGCEGRDLRYERQEISWCQMMVSGCQFLNVLLSLELKFIWWQRRDSGGKVCVDVCSQREG